MNRPKWSKKIGTDGLIIAVAALFFVGALALLWLDTDFSGRVDKDRVAVGKFADNKNDVRRRAGSGFSWTGVQATDLVYEGDSVFTGADSSTNIALDKGSTLAVDPSSLVVIHTVGKDLQFDLQYGGMVGKVTKGQKLLIKNNGDTQEISGDDAEIRVVQTGPDKAMKVQVLKGQIKVAQVRKPGAKPSEVRSISKDEVATFKEKVAPVIQKLKVVLVDPPNGAHRWLPSKSVFGWKREGPTANEPIRFELARDEDFSQIQIAETLNTGSYELPAATKLNGVFYWRVRPTGSQTDAVVANGRKITLYPNVPPTLTKPAMDQELAFSSASSETGKAVLFSWDDPAGSSQFELEVALDETFAKTVYNQKISNLTSNESSKLPAGQYYWRVKGLHPERVAAPYSLISKFNVTDGSKSPERPQFRVSELSFVIPNAAGKNIKDGVVSAPGIPSFEWLPAKDATSYELELSAAETFLQSEKLSVKDQTQYTPVKIHPGPLYARVRGLTKNGTGGAFSVPARLNVTVEAPVIAKIAPMKSVFKTDEEYRSFKKEIDLHWTEQPFAAAYELWWGADPEFKQVKKYRVDLPTLKQKIGNPMDYYVQVRALNKDSRAISAFSSVLKIIYRKELIIRPSLAEKKPSAPVQSPTVAAVASPPAEKPSRMVANTGPLAATTASQTSPVTAALAAIKASSAAKTIPGAAATAAGPSSLVAKNDLNAEASAAPVAIPAAPVAKNDPSADGSVATDASVADKLEPSVDANVAPAASAEALSAPPVAPVAPIADTSANAASSEAPAVEKSKNAAAPMQGQASADDKQKSKTPVEEKALSDHQASQKDQKKAGAPESSVAVSSGSAKLSEKKKKKTSIESAVLAASQVSPVVSPVAAVERRPSAVGRTPSGVFNAGLARPALVEPQKNTPVIALEGSKVFINFRWSPLPGAKEYQIQIAKDPDFETLLGDAFTNNTKMVFQNYLPEGKVHWRVRVVSQTGYGDWSDPADINVLYE